MFDRLLDILEAIPGEVTHRSVSPFFYAGLARRYEEERITEEIRDSLPERINRLRPRKFNSWLSEREWIPVMLETASQPETAAEARCHESNIDYLETALREIIAELEREYQDHTGQFRRLEELCARYGDPDNRRIYMMSRDVEGKWLKLHELATGAPPPID